MSLNPSQFKKFRKPSRYLGNEFNIANKSFDDAKVRFCLIFPDLYEIGMSHLGLKILYHIINSQPDLMADRAFCPDTDFEEFLKNERTPLFGLESKVSLKNFDCLGITLPYELCYTNILTILNLCNIPFYAKDREHGEYPLILGGGSAAVQPEPIAPFFDAIVIGDGENAVLEVAEEIRNAKELNLKKDELLNYLSKINGIYIPTFFKEIKNGDFIVPEPLYSNYQKIIRRTEPDLNKLDFPEKPVIPHLNIIHDRFGIEISRGCTRGCRFCQAGMIYRPVRERQPDKVIEIAKEGIKNSGWEELSFLSLSTGDYSCLTRITGDLIDYFYPRRVSVSLPSLRVGSLNNEIMRHIKKVRKTGFTVAPEAGSERLRRVINKDITEEALIETVKKVFQNGWKGLKLYFMMGLPTEEDEDIFEIINLSRNLQRYAKGKGGATVTVSIGLFVPKAHTPFQWEAQLDDDIALKRLNLLKDNLKSRTIQLKWHDTRMSVMECIFSRGDRSLSKVIERAWEKGARLDSWGDHFNSAFFYESAKELDINLNKFIRFFDINSALPWDHIGTGVCKEYLIAERQKAFNEEYTPDCRWGKCQGCGVCDFKTVNPLCFDECKIKEDMAVEKNDFSENPISENNKADMPDENKEKPQPFYYLVKYSKQGEASLTGHLDLMRIFQRAVTRAGLPVAYSMGFNPGPLMSFDQAMPIGIESLCEQLSMGLKNPVKCEDILAGMNNNLIKGITILNVELQESKKVKKWNTIEYLLVFSEADPAVIKEKLNEYISARGFELLIKDENGKKITINSGKIISEMALIETCDNFCKIRLKVRALQNRNLVKIDELVEKIFEVKNYQAVITDKSYSENAPDLLSV